MRSTSISILNSAHLCLCEFDLCDLSNGKYHFGSSNSFFLSARIRIHHIALSAFFQFFFIARSIQPDFLFYFDWLLLIYAAICVRWARIHEIGCVYFDHGTLMLVTSISHTKLARDAISQCSFIFYSCSLCFPVPPSVHGAHVCVCVCECLHILTTTHNWTKLTISFVPMNRRWASSANLRNHILRWASGTLLQMSSALFAHITDHVPTFIPIQ